MSLSDKFSNGLFRSSQPHLRGLGPGAHGLKLTFEDALVDIVPVALGGEFGFEAGDGGAQLHAFKGCSRHRAQPAQVGALALIYFHCTEAFRADLELVV